MGCSNQSIGHAQGIDAHPGLARTDATDQRDLALDVGGVISTDYPWADGRLSTYRVQFPDGVFVRPHPASSR